MRAVVTLILQLHLFDSFNNVGKYLLHIIELFTLNSIFWFNAKRILFDQSHFCDAYQVFYKSLLFNDFYSRALKLKNLKSSEMDQILVHVKSM